MNPEKMVIREARRAYTYLQLYGYGVDSVVVNRILDVDGDKESVWQKYIESQTRYLTEIEASFSPLPILRVPHLLEEVFGLQLLRKIGEGLYEDRDPTTIFYNEQAYKVTANGEVYCLEIRLPFLDEEHFSVQQFGDQLVIQVQNQRRNYLLPKFLTYYTLTTTKIEDGWLKVRFEPAEKK